MLVNNPELLPNFKLTAKEIGRFTLDVIGSATKRVGRHIGKLVNPFYAPPGSEYPDTEWPQLTEPTDGVWNSDGYVEPMAHDLFDRKWQPPLWKGLPYYHDDHGLDGYYEGDIDRLPPREEL